MGKGLLGVASAIAILTLLSKGFGFFRELVVAVSFGAGVAKDAYTAAYIIPAFSLIMLGGLTGPFHTGAQKVMTALRSRGQDEAVPGVMATILLAVTLVMGALSVLAYVAAPAMIRLVASQASPPVFALAVAQLRVMSPLVLIGGLVGILCGISNDRGDFTLPSLSPLVASIAVIAAVLLRPGDGMSLAWGTMFGGVGQFLLQAPAGVQLLRSRPWRWDFGHPEVRSLFWLLLPASISSTIGTLNVIIGTNFASALPPGEIGIFDYANKLIQLPLGILMTALLIPVFPLLTQAVVAGDREALFRRLNQGISTIALATLPLIALFVAAGRPIVAVMYQHGAFKPDATLLTYQVLAFASLGIFTYAARDLMIRVFYALDDSRTPLLVSLLSMGATAAGMALVIHRFHLMGLAGVTAAITMLNCVLIGLLLRFKLGRLPLGSAIAMSARCGAAAAVAGALAWVVGHGWHHADTFVWNALEAIAQSGVLAVVYVAVLALLGVPVVARAKAVGTRVLRRNRAVEQPS